MSTVTFKGIECHTNGVLPKIGAKAPEFKGVKSDLSELSLKDLKGKRIVLNIFPSLDTAVCATSVRKFNQAAASLQNCEVLAISKDLPFAQGRFCTIEGIERVTALSMFRSCFEDNYGVLLTDGPLKGLFTRCVVVIDEDGNVIHTELVPEITNEPDYETTLNALRK